MTDGKVSSIHAFLLTVGAGLSTCIGAIVILNGKLRHLSRSSVLSVACGVSAGVMIFISLVEIFKESVESFEKNFHKTNTTQDFVQCLGGNLSIPTVQKCSEELGKRCGDKCAGMGMLFATLCFVLGAAIIFLIDYFVHWLSPGTSHELHPEEGNALHSPQKPGDAEVQVPSAKKKDSDNVAEKQKLNRTGILTAIAIGIHNLPEGIAVYLAARQKLSLGVGLAFGIALHNIPEGVAVATPVYHATQSKLKAFLWTFLSALAEPLGGLLCWLLTRYGNDTEINPILNGILYGLVVGMMVTISLKELVPTALRYASSDNQVTFSILAGMIIMAVSVIVLSFAGI